MKVRTLLTFMFCDLNTWSWLFYCLWGDSCWYVVRLRRVQYQRIVRFVIFEENSDLANVCVKVCKCSDRSGSHMLQQLCQSVRRSPLGSQSPSKLLCTVMWCSAPVCCQDWLYCTLGGGCFSLCFWESWAVMPPFVSIVKHQVGLQSLSIDGLLSRINLQCLRFQIVDTYYLSLYFQ